MNPQNLLRSFRFRIALLVGLVFVGVLAVLGVGMWRIVYAAKRARTDSELLTVVARNSQILGYHAARRGGFRPEPEPTTIPESGGVWIWGEDGRRVFPGAKADGGDPDGLAEAVRGFLADKDLPVIAMPRPRRQIPLPGDRDGVFGGGPEGSTLDGPDDRGPPDLRDDGRPTRPPPPERDSDPARNDRPPVITISEADVFLETLEIRGHSWRVAAFHLDRTLVAVTWDLAEAKAEMREIVRAEGVLFGIVAVFAVGAGWLIASRAIRPVVRLTEAARGITAQGLDRRIERTGVTAEFAELIDVFNAMLDRLERHFLQASRFSADAAHELKTPLAILQGQLEQRLNDPATEAAGLELCGSLLEEVQRLKNIVRKLHLLSLSDAGRLDLQTVPLDFSALAEAVWEDAEAFGDGLRFSRTIAPGIRVQGDPDMLTQVLANLLLNATRYNQPGGFVELDVSREGDVAVLRVSNSADAIPAEDAEHVFERFYQVDRSRTNSREGAGLGLSLARDLSRAQGGTLELTGNEAGRVTFSLSLPVLAGDAGVAEE